MQNGHNSVLLFKQTDPKTPSNLDTALWTIYSGRSHQDQDDHQLKEHHNSSYAVLVPDASFALYL
jgi:hypothetical protein